MKKKIIWLVVLTLLLSCALVFAIFHEEIIDFLFPVKNDWDEKDGVIYYKDEEGDPVIGWFQHEGFYYYLDPDQGGAMVTGWLELGDVSYYLDEQGHMLTGWQKISGEDHYFDEDGAMVTGWLQLEEGTYYLSSSGNPVSGWLTLEDGEYYLDENCLMVTGWLEPNGKRYYFDESGVRLTGLTDLDGTLYYLSPDGTITSGWTELEEGTYYLDEKGAAVTGWLELEEGKYYLDGNGSMVTGWLDLEEGRYYLDENGLVVTGLLELDGGKYHLGEDGLMTTGWLELDGRTCYFKEDGTMAVGKVLIDEVPHYFTSTGAHLILVNRWNPVPEDYEANLVTFKGWQMDASCYDDLVKMLDDCPYGYTITAAYRSKATQQSIWNRRLANYKASGYSSASAEAMVASYVAVPGTSEHQLGLAIDISGANAQKWLAEHCWEYGFILRYLDGKSDITGIAYERWHFRYVGAELAMEMKDTGLCLEEYMDQLTNDGTTCGNPDALEDDTTSEAA